MPQDSSGKPTRFRFLASEYSVQFDAGIIAEMGRQQIPPVVMLGYSDTERRLIAILPSLGEDGQKQTFLHELFHVFSYPASLGLDERQVEWLGHAMLSFLRDNPEVVAWLTQ